MSNQSQKSSSTFSLPEGDLTSQDRYRCNSIKSTQSFEVPRPFSHTRLHDLNSRFILKKTNSQTALQRQHKDAKSFLQLDRVQRESSNELAMHDSDTGGAVGSSIHFTMEDNSLSNAQRNYKTINQQTPTNNSSARGMFGSLGHNSGENKLRFNRGFTGSGISGNWSSSGSEGGRGRGSGSLLSSELGGKFNRFGGLPL